ncbi:hypothetical protein EX30DRAFT_119280 [Ascodesmis nigricans]|uniref:Uncharacterized protein n=1 Tax=Ascodesmis nigricans TaxID=341454 RepID=A0A4S2MPV4_9PEZI|nr:hypothetical protein EX30DRAFT_119280 [Ascodesmis nigricans]
MPRKSRPQTTIQFLSIPKNMVILASILTPARQFLYQPTEHTSFYGWMQISLSYYSNSIQLRSGYDSPPTLTDSNPLRHAQHHHLPEATQMIHHHPSRSPSILMKIHGSPRLNPSLSHPSQILTQSHLTSPHHPDRHRNRPPPRVRDPVPSLPPSAPSSSPSSPVAQCYSTPITIGCRSRAVTNPKTLAAPSVGVCQSALSPECVYAYTYAVRVGETDVRGLYPHNYTASTAR